jgi:hypothetical protein
LGYYPRAELKVYIMSFTSLWLTLGLVRASLAELRFEDGKVLGIEPRDLEARAVNCKVVTGVLAVVKAAGKPARTFCSSYLKIPAMATVTITTSGPAAYVHHSLL